MDAIIFNGRVEAARRQAALRQRVARLTQPPAIASVFFAEDEGSVLYTRLKKQAAESCGIAFQEYAFNIANSDLAGPLAKIATLAESNAITGTIVQKPMQDIWQQTYTGTATFDAWWTKLAAAVPTPKDVDGLAPATLGAIKQGRWTILPATVKAVLIALEAALDMPALTQPGTHQLRKLGKTAIVGCSDIIGLPLADVLRHHGSSPQLICDNVNKEQLLGADIVISATGTPGIISGDMVKEDVIAIDVGAPRADFDFTSVAPKARFITPVPGGIGPLTVTCLLENAVQLAEAPAPVTV